MTNEYNIAYPTKVDQATLLAGEDLLNNALVTETRVLYANISASALIYAGPARFFGFIINSCAASATIKVWDQTSAAVPVLLNTITLAVNDARCYVLPVGINCTNGIYVTIAVAAADITVLYQPTIV